VHFGMIPARHTYIIYGWPCRIDSYIANNFRLSLECRIWPLYGIYILVPPIFPPQLLDKCAAVLKLKSKSTLSHCFQFCFPFYMWNASAFGFLLLWCLSPLHYAPTFWLLCCCFFRWLATELVSWKIMTAH